MQQSDERPLAGMLLLGIRTAASARYENVLRLMGKLRKQWGELPLEKKLGIVVPVFVACLTGVVVPILLAGGGDEAGSSDPQSELEVIDLAVTGGHSPPEGTPDDLQTIDVTVRNAGELVSIVKRIGFRVLDTGFLEICQAGGGLEPSEAYDLQLPASIEKGDVPELKVSQQIPPGEADRFTVRLDVPEPDRQLGRYLHRLQVLLFHDTDPEPISGGNVLVSVPFLPDSNFFWSAVPPSSRPSFEGAGGVVKRCLQENEAIYQELLALEAERSPELTPDLTQAP